MIALLALPAAMVADSLMGPGVSLQLARYRVERVADVRYDLALDVTRRDTAIGSIRVHFNRKRDGDVIIDFRGHWIRDVRVNAKGVRSWELGASKDSSFEFNGHHVRVPAALIRSGANTIDMRFAAPIAPAGASIIRFTDERDKREYLYTLLVPATRISCFRALISRI